MVRGPDCRWDTWLPPSHDIKLVLNSQSHNGTGIDMQQDDTTSQFTWTLSLDLGVQFLKHVTVAACICSDITWFEVKKQVSIHSGLFGWIYHLVWYYLTWSVRTSHLHCSTQVTASVFAKSNVQMHHIHCYSSASNKHSASTRHFSDTRYNYSKFGGTVPVLQMSLLLPSTHKSDAVISYKMIVHVYRTTQHHISEGSDYQNTDQTFG